MKAKSDSICIYSDSCLQALLTNRFAAVLELNITRKVKGMEQKPEIFRLQMMIFISRNRAVSIHDFNIQYCNPFLTSDIAHLLAMIVPKHRW